ncbi:putative calcium-binding protein CML45 [Carex littledalei]|uniref:Putative calcium-binding protein CML45 n=1 Tax=Carex littledalei TaxID=544730 RepID=A0A833VYP4_9POAL|nr:putative calcium-binding protein CML45 [Carex littledalei]
MGRFPVFDLIPCCSYSVLPCYLLHLSKYALCCSLKTARLCCMYSLLIDYYGYINNHHHSSYNNINDEEGEGEGEKEEEENALPNCEKHDTKDELTYDNINTVMSSLGVEGWKDIQKHDKELIQEAHKLLDSKNASLEELKEAFYVFDRNEDGFITAFELWSVLRRLGLKEGMKYEDCEEMIRVYDKNGDGRICFNEFKNMMEQAL